MANNPTPPDYTELLSAYIDDALSPDARETITAALAENPALQTELDDLQTTVQLLRNLPTLSAPRDYTLTPEMVAPPRLLFFPATAWMSLVSAAAAVALIVSGVLLSLASMGPTIGAVAEIALEPTLGRAAESTGMTNNAPAAGGMAAPTVTLPRDEADTEGAVGEFAPQAPAIAEAELFAADEDMEAEAAEEVVAPMLDAVADEFAAGDDAPTDADDGIALQATTPAPLPTTPASAAQGRILTTDIPPTATLPPPTRTIVPTPPESLLRESPPAKRPAISPLRFWGGLLIAMGGVFGVLAVAIYRTKRTSP
jgi:hypothetical protein